MQIIESILAGVVYITVWLVSVVIMVFLLVIVINALKDSFR